jgi:vacuolar-type H+-ATPase subunit I/STV1
MNNIYDAEFHPLIYTPVYQNNWRRWINFFIYVAVMIFIISFIVVDLYYGCTDIKCLNGVADPIPMSLSAWLQFSGMIGLIILIFAIAFGCCCSISPSAHLIINMIPQIMMFSWILIGNVIYWKNYYQNNTCDKSIISYLMIRFYVGILIIVIAVYHEIKSYR